MTNEEKINSIKELLETYTVNTVKEEHKEIFIRSKERLLDDLQKLDIPNIKSSESFECKEDFEDYIYDDVGKKINKIIRKMNNVFRIMDAENDTSAYEDIITEVLGLDIYIELPYEGSSNSIPDEALEYFDISVVIPGHTKYRITKYPIVIESQYGDYVISSGSLELIK